MSIPMLIKPSTNDFDNSSLESLPSLPTIIFFSFGYISLKAIAIALATSEFNWESQTPLISYALKIFSFKLSLVITTMPKTSS